MNIPLLELRPLPAEDLSAITPVLLDLPVILGESRHQNTPFMTILDEYGYYANANPRPSHGLLGEGWPQTLDRPHPCHAKLDGFFHSKTQGFPRLRNLTNRRAQ